MTQSAIIEKLCNGHSDKQLLHQWLNNVIFPRIKSQEIVTLIKKSHHIRATRCINKYAIKKGFCPITGYTKMLEYDIYVRSKRAPYRCSRTGARILNRLIELKKLFIEISTTNSHLSTYQVSRWKQLVHDVDALFDSEFRIRPIKLRKTD